MLKLLRVTTFVAVVMPQVAYSATLLVPDDFATIQAAIDAAQDGDTIEVSGGTYEENLRISSLANVTLSGTNAILDGDPNVDAIRIQNSLGIVVSGFTIQDGWNAVRVKISPNTSIMGNLIDGTQSGIRIQRSGGSTVTDNVVQALTGFTDIFGRLLGGHGIRIKLSDSAVVMGNRVSDPPGQAMNVVGGSNVAITSNVIAGAGKNGIRAKKLDEASVTGNQSSNGKSSGLRVKKATNSVFDNNSCPGNTRLGILLHRVTGGTITNNTADNNTRYGIRLKKSSTSSVDDLIADGNSATGNAVADYRVDKDVQ